MSRIEDHPSPNTPARPSSELYIRVSRSDAACPEKDRSVSGSRKLPVAVLTGSSANPFVGGVPIAENGPMVKSSRPASIPAADRAAAIAASDSVAGPAPPPAASNCAATVPAQSASCPFAVSQSLTAVSSDWAFSVPQQGLHSAS